MRGAGIVGVQRSLMWWRGQAEEWWPLQGGAGAAVGLTNMKQPELELLVFDYRSLGEFSPEFRIVWFCCTAAAATQEVTRLKG